MTTQPVPNITPFTYEGCEVRTLDINGEPWFVTGDVCDYFGVTNRNRVMQHVDPEDKGGTQIDTPGGRQTVSIVNESGLYTLLFHLQPTKARGLTDSEVEAKTALVRSFRRWVTHEVLPAIRRTGTYATTPSVPQPDLSELSPRNLAYLSELAKGLEAAVKHAEKNQRKADGYDQFLNGSGCYLVDTAANLLGVKHRRLWEWLYTSKLLIPHGPRKRQPYANPKTASWFAVKTYNTDRTNGKARATTYITPVGLEAIRLRLIREGVIQSTLFALPAPVREVLA